MKHLNRSERKNFLEGSASKKLLSLNVVMAIAYFCVITFGFHPGNLVLFYALVAGEVFHLFQILTYCYTVWNPNYSAPSTKHFTKPVDVFITVCGEPVEIVRETARAALAMQYPDFNVYLLNDGYVAKKDNWKEIDALASELGITAITRRTSGGAKAGNINNALAQTTAPYFVIFDADHVPYPTFLKKTMGYFIDTNMGFVQTPQFYKNQNINDVAQTAWRQQTLFFGPIMRGKNRLNSAFMCGTNMVLNRQAIKEAGGMCEFNIAEDFLTSLFVHAKGWKSLYIPEVLAEGLATEDFLSYYKQQFRWTRGSLEVIFKYNPFLMKGLTLKQKIQYISSASYYLSGVVILIDALLPLLFVFTGITAVETSTMTLALIFIPYIFLNLYTLQRTSNFSYTFEAIAFSIGSFYLQIKALFGVIFNRSSSFVVTSKSQVEGSFGRLVIPQISYIVIAGIGVVVGLLREGISASLLANLAWIVITSVLFLPSITAAIQPKSSLHNPLRSLLAFVPKITRSARLKYAEETKS